MITKLEKDEEIIAKYSDKPNKEVSLPNLGGWGNLRVARGTLFLTNHRIIFESLDSKWASAGEIVQIHWHNKINDTHGKDTGLFSGFLLLYEEGGLVRYQLYNGQKLSNYLNQSFYSPKAKARNCEKRLDYDKAILIYEENNMSVEATRVRKLMVEQGSAKVEQTVVHGDYIDDRDTTINQMTKVHNISKTEVKDSVLNRSNVGGGSSKAEELREAKSLFEEGLIDDAEFRQMKKEILGK